MLIEIASENTANRRKLQINTLYIELFLDIIVNRLVINKVRFNMICIIHH